MRLTRIDETQRNDHRFLQPSDDCSFLGEFTARKGFEFSETNKYIFNLKIPPSRAASKQFFANLKNNAINYWGRKLREAAPPASTANYTWVPVPCSKLANHPEFDDRLARLLLGPYAGQNEIDVRKIIKCKADRDAAHLGTDRPTPDVLQENYEIDESVSLDGISKIIIFDDVITRGASFKAMQAVLNGLMPQVPVQGVFLARTVHDDASGLFSLILEE